MQYPVGFELLRGDTSVDIEATRRQVTVTLDTDEQESQYQQQDWRLHAQIQGLATKTLGAERAEALLTVHDDRYPNKTKSLTCDQSAVSAGLVGELQGLLQGEFGDWCHAIEVYRRSNGQEHEVGPVRVYAEKVFAVQALAHDVTGAPQPLAQPNPHQNGS